jgi:hypothetical protein
MHLFRVIFSRLLAEFRTHRFGRRALREVRFAKYKVTSEPGDRSCRERVLRRLPRHLWIPSLHTTT